MSKREGRIQSTLLLSGMEQINGYTSDARLLPAPIRGRMVGGPSTLGIRRRTLDEAIQEAHAKYSNWDFRIVPTEEFGERENPLQFTLSYSDRGSAVLTYAGTDGVNYTVEGDTIQAAWSQAVYRSDHGAELLVSADVISTRRERPQ